MIVWLSPTIISLQFIVGKHNPEFAGTTQQDSHDFLTFLMDGLHEGLNKVRLKHCWLQRSRQGLTKSTSKSQCLQRPRQGLTKSTSKLQCLQRPQQGLTKINLKIAMSVEISLGPHQINFKIAMRASPRMCFSIFRHSLITSNKVNIDKDHLLDVHCVVLEL